MKPKRQERAAPNGCGPLLSMSDRLMGDGTSRNSQFVNTTILLVTAEFEMVMEGGADDVPGLNFTV